MGGERDDAKARRRRAEELRSRIHEIEMGQESGVEKTPRQITDEAARKEKDKENPSKEEK